MNSPHASSGPFGQRRGPAKNGKGPRASSENQRMEGPCFAFPLQNHQQYHTHGSTALTAATYQSLPLFGSCIILTFRYNNNHYIPTYIILYYIILYHSILYQYIIPIFIYHTSPISPCHQFFGSQSTWCRPNLLASSQRWRFSWGFFSTASGWLPSYWADGKIPKTIPNPSGWKLSPFEYWIPPWFSFLIPMVFVEPFLFLPALFPPSLDSAYCEFLSHRDVTTKFMSITVLMFLPIITSWFFRIFMLISVSNWWVQYNPPPPVWWLSIPGIASGTLPGVLNDSPEPMVFFGFSYWKNGQKNPTWMAKNDPQSYKSMALKMNLSKKNHGWLGWLGTIYLRIIKYLQKPQVHLSHLLFAKADLHGILGLVQRCYRDFFKPGEFGYQIPTDPQQPTRTCTKLIKTANINGCDNRYDYDKQKCRCFFKK